MCRFVAAATLGLLCCVAAVGAADLSVNVSPRANFAALRTFELREARIKSSRPEFDNELFVKKLNATIRAALLANGLREETTGRADVVVDYALTTEDINTVRSEPPRGPLRYTSSTLLIDVKLRGETDPVWRGVYRDEDAASTKLVDRFVDGAKKLVGRYPKQRS
jgi:hypothetical protein